MSDPTPTDETQAAQMVDILDALLHPGRDPITLPELVSKDFDGAIKMVAQAIADERERVTLELCEQEGNNLAAIYRIGYVAGPAVVLRGYDAIVKYAIAAIEKTRA